MTWSVVAAHACEAARAMAASTSRAGRMVIAP
jgi:hypothetical protein